MFGGKERIREDQPLAGPPQAQSHNPRTSKIRHNRWLSSAEVEDYRQAVEAKTSRHSIPISATFEVEDQELHAIETEFGKGVLTQKQFKYERTYENTSFVSIYVNQKIAGATLLKHAGMETEVPSGTWIDLETLQSRVAWYGMKFRDGRDSAKSEIAACSGCADNQSIDGHPCEPFVN
jgi:hypothetical protein